MPDFLLQFSDQKCPACGQVHNYTIQVQTQLLFSGGQKGSSSQRSHQVQVTCPATNHPYVVQVTFSLASNNKVVGLRQVRG